MCFHDSVSCHTLGDHTVEGMVRHCSVFCCACAECICNWKLWRLKGEDSKEPTDPKLVFTEMLLQDCEGLMLDPHREDTVTSHEQLRAFVSLADFVRDGRATTMVAIPQNCNKSEIMEIVESTQLIHCLYRTCNTGCFLRTEHSAHLPFHSSMKIVMTIHEDRMKVLQ